MKKLTRYVLWPIAVALAVLVVGVATVTCGGDTADTNTPSLDRVSAMHGPINGQGNGAVTSFNGVVDPTNVLWAGVGEPGGMVTCLSSCTGDTARNSGAFLTAAVYATSSSTPRTMYVPPGQYPLPCTVDLGGLSNLVVSAYGVTFRLTGTCASSGMFLVHNGSSVEFDGATFDMRDATGTNSDTVAMLVGD